MGPFGFVTSAWDAIPAAWQWGILGCVAMLVVIGVVDLMRTTREPAEVRTRPRRRRKGVRRWTRE